MWTRCTVGTSRTPKWPFWMALSLFHSQVNLPAISGNAPPPCAARDPAAVVALRPWRISAEHCGPSAPPAVHNCSWPGKLGLGPRVYQLTRCLQVQYTRAPSKPPVGCAQPKVWRQGGPDGPEAYSGSPSILKASSGGKDINLAASLCCQALSFIQWCHVTCNVAPIRFRHHKTMQNPSRGASPSQVLATPRHSGVNRKPLAVVTRTA